MRLPFRNGRLPGLAVLVVVMGVFAPELVVAQSQSEAQLIVRLQELEERMRTLNGYVEDLQFKVQQLTEQLAKAQEDNEFRFQQLEGGTQGKQPPAQKKSDATTDTNTDVAAVPATQAPSDAATAPAGGQSVEDVIVESPNGDPGKVVPGTGAPEKTFGSITVDKNGNVIDAGGNTQAIAPAQDTAPAVSPATGAP
ncbi:MAG: tol-pal system protein YbgF, partial [Devosia sp.]